MEPVEWSELCVSSSRPSDESVHALFIAAQLYSVPASGPRTVAFDRIIETADLFLDTWKARWDDRPEDGPEPAVKPCPFCGRVPVVGGGVVKCGNDDCSLWGWPVAVTDWNRRAE